MNWQTILDPPCPYCAVWIGPHDHSMRADGTLGGVVRRVDADGQPLPVPTLEHGEMPEDADGERVMKDCGGSDERWDGSE